MPTAARRGRRVTPAVTWAAIAAALVVHGAVLGSVEAFDLKVVGVGMSTRGAEPVAVTEIKPTCVGDALLASSARYSMCLAPWREDPEQCLDGAEIDMFMDLSSCVVQHNPSAVSSISMLEPKVAAQLTPIDPEPLLEMMKPQEQPKPPELVQAQPQAQPPAPPPPPAQKRPMQVVETAKPSAEKAPDDARLLAEFDTAVQKQTVARGSVKEPMTAKSKAEELAAKADPREASVKEQPDRPRGANLQAPDVPGTLSMRTPGAQAPAETQQDAITRGNTVGANGPIAFDGFVPRKGDGAFEQQRHERSEIPRGQSGAGGGAPDVVKIKPTQDVLERALGGGSVDHLDDVASGEETALNAKRWIHATFFNRLKRQVAQNWDPATVWRRRDPNGQVYGFKTRITEVRVALTARGDLAKIVVTSPSGVSELDDEALRSFHAAAPFPNPPKELANDDGFITFAFSFYFEIGAPRTSWRVIRSM